MYEHRPLTCRLSGVPIVNVDGVAIQSEGCKGCTLKAEETPRLDCDSLRRDERKILRKRYPGKGGVSLLIPQAVSTIKP